MPDCRYWHAGHAGHAGHVGLSSKLGLRSNNAEYRSFLSPRGDTLSAAGAMKEGASDFFAKLIVGGVIMLAVEYGLEKDRDARKTKDPRIARTRDSTRECDRPDLTEAV
jgi:FixJ family two-component response regulator